MKRIFFVTIVICCAIGLSFGQTTTAPVGKTGQKLINATEKTMNTSSRMSENTAQISANAQNIAGNVKNIAKLFEPFVARMSKAKTPDTGNATVNMDANSTAVVQESEHVISDVSQPAESGSGNQTQTNSEATAGAPSAQQNNGNYNSDGTANLGTQNSNKYGCYIDLSHGQVLDDIDVAGQTRLVDLVFTANDAPSPKYAFLTPAYIKDNAFITYYYKGIKYKSNKEIPVKSWDQVNESQVAMTALSGEQFEKIQSSSQLEAVVKQIKTFSDHIESNERYEGKVVAIQTQLDDRTCYGLLYIVKQYGTNRENSYIKVKLKVTGTDTNGDGIPD